MKKIFYIFLICTVLFIGMELGTTSKETISKDIQDEINEFEEELGRPDNKYTPGSSKNKIDPNITNNIAKGGEKAITGFFDFAFGVLESILGSK